MTSGELVAEPMPSHRKALELETTKSSHSPKHVTDRVTRRDDDGSHWYATGSDWVGAVSGTNRV